MLIVRIRDCWGGINVYFRCRLVFFFIIFVIVKRDRFWIFKSLLKGGKGRFGEEGSGEGVSVYVFRFFE